MRPVNVGFQINVHRVSVRAIMKKSSIVIIASCCAGFILGAVIWFVLPLLVPQFNWRDGLAGWRFWSGSHFSTDARDFFLWSSISAFIGGYIGYRFSRTPK